MDSDPRVSPSPLEYFKSHPFVPVSLALSIVALGFGAVSMLHLPSTQGASPAGFVQVDEKASLPTSSMAVDIEGQVAHPELLLVENDPEKPVRVADIISKAGGLLPSADASYVQKNINLASVVTDGMKFYIPKNGEGSSGQAVLGMTTVGGKINVNSATLNELQKLQGVGATRAQTILDHRPYGSLEDLKSKTQLTSVIEKIKDEISF